MASAMMSTANIRTVQDARGRSGLRQKPSAPVAHRSTVRPTATLQASRPTHKAPAEAPWESPLQEPLLWQSTVKTVPKGLKYAQPGLMPAWRMTLLSDGSVTRHLQLLTGEEVKVDCLDQVEIGMETNGLPDIVSLIEGPRVQRQVQLCAGGRPWVTATSWWNAQQVNQFMRETDQPIWANMASRKTELYREIKNVYYGASAIQEGIFGHAGPFLGREYIFWHAGKPLTVIQEIFSPKLRDFLGPMYKDF